MAMCIRGKTKATYKRHKFTKTTNQGTVCVHCDAKEPMGSTLRRQRRIQK